MNNLMRMISRMKKSSTRKEVNKKIVRILNQTRVMMTKMMIVMRKNQAAV